MNPVGKHFSKVATQFLTRLEKKVLILNLRKTILKSCVNDSPDRTEQRIIYNSSHNDHLIIADPD